MKSLIVSALQQVVSPKERAGGSLYMIWALMCQAWQWCSPQSMGPSIPWFHPRGAHPKSGFLLINTFGSTCFNGLFWLKSRPTPVLSTLVTFDYVTSFFLWIALLWFELEKGRVWTCVTFIARELIRMNTSEMLGILEFKCSLSILVSLHATDLEVLSTLFFFHLYNLHVHDLHGSGSSIEPTDSPIQVLEFFNQGGPG